jgi:hypothetical protein
MVDNAWIGLIGALGGVVATGAIGTGTAALTHSWQEGTRKRERADRLRESRATLRRDAYIRFLVSAEDVTDFVLAQQPGDGDLKQASEVRERLRRLRKSGDAQFAEYFAARLQVNLVASEQVNSKFEEFVNWMNGQIGVAVGQADPLESGAFDGHAERRKELVEAMRMEQESDLVVED